MSIVLLSTVGSYYAVTSPQLNKTMLLKLNLWQCAVPGTNANKMSGSLRTIDFTPDTSSFAVFGCVTSFAIEPASQLFAPSVDEPFESDFALRRDCGLCTQYRTILFPLAGT
jgi:hypothetical protein